MPDRTTKVTLTADTSGYVAGMDKAAGATKKMTDEAQQKLAKHDAAMTQVGTTSLAMGAVVGAGVALAVKKFADFDQAMSYVDAATHETAGNMQLLRDAAIEAGARTVFSATESANAIEELGKAGVSTKDILAGGLNGALDLAAAGGLGVADAAGIAATALKVFGLQGQDMGHVADLLAAGAGKAMGSVEDLAQAMKFVGPVAAGMGVSIDETVGTLAAFASQGILADNAGTGLRGMLSSLTSPSKVASAELSKLGVQLYDGQGKFLGLANMAGQLTQAYANMDDQQKDTSLGLIFGNQQITAARVVLKEGQKGIEAWTKAVNDQGYAADTARRRLNNLSGDLEQLGGSMDTALIKTGSGANDMLRQMTQLATGLVNAVGEIPAPILGVGLGLGALVAALGLAGGGLLTIIPKIHATRLAMEELELSGRRLALGLAKGGLVMAALTVFSIGMAGVGTEAELTKQQVSDLNAAIKLMDTKKLDELFTEHRNNGAAADINSMKEALDGLTSGDFFKNRQANMNVGSFFDSISFGWFNLSGDMKKFQAQFKSMGVALAETAKTDLPTASSQFNKYVKALGGGRTVVKQLLEAMPDYAIALQDLATANGVTLSKTDLLNLAQGKGALAADLLARGVGGVTNAVQAAQEATEAATKAQDDWIKSVSDSDASFIDLGGSYDTLVQKNKDVAQATADSTKSSSDSWDDFYDGFTISLGDYLTELQKQADAQNDWEKNMILLSGRVSQGVIDELSQLGPKAAPLVAQLVTASDEQLSKLDDLYSEKASEATGAFANTLLDSGAVVRAASAQLGENAAAEIAQKLADGTATVQGIITQYGLKIEGLRPQIQIGTEQAQANLDAFYKTYQQRDLTIGVRVANGRGSGGITFSDAGPGKADGGAIVGSGGPRQDNILVAASNGEHMLDAEDVRRMGGQDAVYAFRASLYRGYADGGAIGFTPAPVYTPAPPRMYTPGPGAPMPPINVIVQPKGGIDLLQYIDVRVEQSSAADYQIQERGFRG